jgi:hypothetical protein
MKEKRSFWVTVEIIGKIEAESKEAAEDAAYLHFGELLENSPTWSVEDTQAFLLLRHNPINVHLC